MRNPKFPSKTSAVAMRSLGRQPANPLRIVPIISLYCPVVSAAVFLFIVSRLLSVRIIVLKSSFLLGIGEDCYQYLGFTVRISGLLGTL